MFPFIFGTFHFNLVAILRRAMNLGTIELFTVSRLNLVFLFSGRGQRVPADEGPVGHQQDQAQQDQVQEEVSRQGAGGAGGQAGQAERRGQGSGGTDCCRSERRGNRS